jgi:hypothetical protein
LVELDSKTNFSLPYGNQEGNHGFGQIGVWHLAHEFDFSLVFCIGRIPALIREALSVTPV